MRESIIGAWRIKQSGVRLIWIPKLYAFLCLTKCWVLWSPPQCCLESARHFVYLLLWTKTSSMGTLIENFCCLFVQLRDFLLFSQIIYDGGWRMNMLKCCVNKSKYTKTWFKCPNSVGYVNDFSKLLTINYNCFITMLNS